MIRSHSGLPIVWLVVHADHTLTKQTACSESDRRLSMAKPSHFVQFVDSLKIPVFVFLFRLVRDETLAEQLTQEAFLELYQSNNDCGDGERSVATIYRTAIRLATQAAASSSLAASPSSRFDRKEVAIFQAIGELPSAQRFAVLLHKYQGLDLAQIGKTLEIDEIRVKALLLAGYQTLRIKLSACVNAERRTE